MIIWYLDLNIFAKLALLIPLFIIMIILSYCRRPLLSAAFEIVEKKEKIDFKFWHYLFIWLIIPMYLLKSILSLIFSFEAFNYFLSQKTFLKGYRTQIIYWHKMPLLESLFSLFFVPFAFIHELLFTFYNILFFIVEKLYNILKEIWVQLNQLWKSLGGLYRSLK